MTKQDKVFLMFFLALCIRLICLYLFRNITNYDLQSYIQVGELTLRGINIYPDVANLHHPYLPFFLYIEAMAVYFGQSKIIVITIIKFINIIFDLGILYLIYLLSKKNLKTAFLYAVNPVTILITTLHGQFDVIPVFFILLAIYLLNKKRNLLALLSYSFAILTKTWPILFIIPILRKLHLCHSRPRSESRAGSGGNPGHQALDPLLRGDDKFIKWKMLLLILFFPILFTVLYCLLFKATLIDIGKMLISYQGLWGIWGPWALLGKTRILWEKLSTSIFLLSFFGYSWFNKDLPAQARKNPIKNILNLLFFFFVFTTNFSIQYFVWLIPFLIIIKPKRHFQLIILITIYLLSFYSVWIFNFSNKWLTIPQNVIGFVLWLSFIKIGYLSRK